MHRGAFQRFNFMSGISFGWQNRLRHRRFGGKTADLGLDIQFLTPEGLAGKNVFNRQIEEKCQHAVDITDQAIGQEQIKMFFRDGQDIPVAAQRTQCYRLLRADADGRSQGDKDPA